MIKSIPPYSSSMKNRRKTMRGDFFTLILTAALIFVQPAHALEELSGDGKPTLTMQDYIKDYVDIPEGAVDWKLIGSTKEKEISGVSPDGLEFGYSTPIFSADLKKLDGKTIKIKGFMFPLEESDAQSMFLFGPFPISCPYHYHVGPTLTIEAHAKKPVDFSYDPIVLEGTLELIPEDRETNVFYRLKDAKIVK